MSTKILHILERLVEMFPEANYQARLEQYISSRRPVSTADIELLERQYWHQNSQGSQL